MSEKLTESNFRSFAEKHYDDSQCLTTEEFEEDLKRFLYLKRLFTTYLSGGKLKTRLILNHMTVLYNLFGDAATSMFFFKIDSSSWNVLVAFVKHFNKRIPADIADGDLIVPDQYVVDELNKV